MRSLQLPPKLQATFAAAGAQLNAVVEAEFLASLCGLVAAGTGWSLVDRLSAESFSHLGLVARPFEPRQRSAEGRRRSVTAGLKAAR